MYLIGFEESDLHLPIYWSKLQSFLFRATWRYILKIISQRIVQEAERNQDCVQMKLLFWDIENQILHISEYYELADAVKTAQKFNVFESLMIP